MKIRFLILAAALAAAAWPAAAQSPTPTPTPAPTPIPPLTTTIAIVSATGALTAAPGSINFADPAFGGVISPSHLPTSSGGTGNLTLPATATAPSGQFINAYSASTGAFSFGTPAGGSGGSSGVFPATVSPPTSQFLNGYNASTGQFSYSSLPSGFSAFSAASGKTEQFNNTLTFAGTDGSTLNVGTGGTLNSAAYQPASAFVATNSVLPVGSIPAIPFNNLPNSLERNFTLEAGVIDPFITNNTASSTTQALYSSINDATHVYTANASLWLPSNPYGLNCVSVASTSGWTFTLVTQMDAITAWHTTAIGSGGGGSQVGDNVYFLGNNGTTFTVTIGTITRIGSTDLAVVNFTSVAGTARYVPPAVVMPPTLPAGYTFAGSPVAYVRQDRNLYVGDVVSLQSSGLDNITVATESNRAPWSYSPNSTTAGDSSRPVFLLLGQQPVFLFAFATGAAPSSGGPDIGANAAAITPYLSSNRALIVAPLPVAPLPANVALTANFAAATGKTLTLNNTVSLSGVDGSTVNFRAGGSVVYTSDSGNLFAPGGPLGPSIWGGTGPGYYAFGNDARFGVALTPVTAQTASYTPLNSDNNSTQVFSGAAAKVVAYPAPTSTTFVNGWNQTLKNIGPGTLAITPVAPTTIDGLTTLPIPVGAVVNVTADGTGNYRTKYVSTIANAAANQAVMSPNGASGIPVPRNIVGADLAGAGINQPGLYVPAGWGATWYPKLLAAQAGTGKATLAAVGDSITQGYYSSNWQTASWFALLRASLQGTVGGTGDGGSGFRSAADTSTYQIANGQTTATMAPYVSNGSLIAQTGTWTASRSLSDGPGWCTVYSTTVGSTLTFPARGTNVEVYYLNVVNPGAFTVTIDGGTALSPTFANSNTPGTYTVTGLTNTTHSVVINVTTAGTNGVYVNGVSGFNATGVTCNRFAMGGASSYEVTNKPGQTTPISGLGGSAANTNAPGGTWSGGSNYPADLVIYAMGVNDAGQFATTPDQYLINVREYLDNVKQGSGQTGSTEIVIMAPNVGLFDTTVWPTYLYSSFQARLRGLAESYGAMYVDFWTLGKNSYPYWSSLGYWGNSTVGSYGTSGTDTVHPSDAGSAFYAGKMLSLIQAQY